MSSNPYQPPTAELRTGQESIRFVRVRISTAILLVALVCFPFSSLWMMPPQLFPQGSKAQETFSWFLYDFSGGLFFVAFVVALVTAIASGITGRWRTIPQMLLEMLVGLMAFMFLPAY